MAGKWGSGIALVVLLGLMVGCRTPPPVLKPDNFEEKYVDPPQEARYDSSNMPKQAFDKVVDPGQALRDAKNTPGMPSRGGMMPTSGMSR